MSAPVPFADLARQHEGLGGELEAAALRVLRSGRYVLGPEVERFERLAAELLGARHAIGVTSGTDALQVALMAAGVGRGDEVVTTPFTFFATVEAILRVGATPVLVDVDPASLNVDAERVEDAVSSRTRAIVPVHLFGSASRIDLLAETATRRSLVLVEDAAQAFGATHAGRALGTFGALGCYSFFPAKVLGAAGDAGLVVTADDALAARCRQLRQHGSGRRGEHVEVGGNFRMDAVQAALLAVKIGHVREWVLVRRAHVAAYQAAFRPIAGLSLLPVTEGTNAAAYTVRVLEGRRDALRAHLDARGVETAIYYPHPVHLQPALAHLGFRRGAFPESECAAAEVLSLPVHAELTAAQRSCVIEAVTTFFA